MGEESTSTTLVVLLLDKNTEWDLIKYIKGTIAGLSSYDIVL